MRVQVMGFLFLLSLAVGACTLKEESAVPTDGDQVSVSDDASDVSELIDHADIPDDTEGELLNDAEALDEETIVSPEEFPDLDAANDETPDGDAPFPAGAYQQCDPGMPNGCPAPMACVKGYETAQYGQCLMSCNENTDCPPPPDPATMQVACHTIEKVCLILCGAYQSDCPVWLECFGQEMCLPPSTVSPTKGPGEICSGKDECLGDSDCIEGQSGVPHCYPLCDPSVPNDCANKAPGYQAQCTNAGGFSFCMFTCQGGVPCPGDLTCIAGVFCQG